MASSKCFVSGTATATNRFNTDNELTKTKALRAAIPDDLHESMLHKNWIETFDRMGAFLHRFVWEKQKPPATN